MNNRMLKWAMGRVALALLGLVAVPCVASAGEGVEPLIVAEATVPPAQQPRVSTARQVAPDPVSDILNDTPMTTVSSTSQRSVSARQATPSFHPQRVAQQQASVTTHRLPKERTHATSPKASRGEAQATRLSPSARAKRATHAAHGQAVRPYPKAHARTGTTLAKDGGKAAPLKRQPRGPGKRRGAATGTGQPALASGKKVAAPRHARATASRQPGKTHKHRIHGVLHPVAHPVASPKSKQG